MNAGIVTLVIAYVLSQFYRSAYRFYLPPGATYEDVGFRCARDP